ncbi:LysR family transcriptional regulator, partial [Leucothrix sargassi]
MNSTEFNWQDIRLFLAVAEQGSFSAAARQLKLGQPTLSRRIAEFEEQLGQPLFSRKSQGCELTAFGSKLLPAAEQMALWSAEAVSQVQTPNRFEGRVCITAPPSVAFAFLPPFAAKLKQHYPDIQLEVRSDINTLNLSRGEADLSLRTRSPEHDDLISLYSFSGHMQVYASHELAKSLEDKTSIHDKDWICWPDDFDHLETNRVLKREIPDFKPTFTANDYNVQIAACCSGLGVLALPEGIDRIGFITGLTPLDIDLTQYTKGELHIVVHKRQQHIPRVAKVSELLSEFFKEVWNIND